MSNISPKSNITVIDSEESLLPLLDSIASLAIKPPSLYINLEEIALGRHGSISILSLHIAPTKETYLIDIHTLQGAAFSTTTTSGTSLKSVLESPTIPKVVFDIQNESDALFNLFQISVDGIIDLQLMGSVTKSGSVKFAAVLAGCIERDSRIDVRQKNRWRHAKEDGQRFFAPEMGGRFDILNERPIKPEIIQYCQLDVALFPGLYNTYARQGSDRERHRILEQTKLRVKRSQSPHYDKHSMSKVFGWDDGYKSKLIESWIGGIVVEVGGPIPDEHLAGMRLQDHGHFSDNMDVSDEDEWF
ncbi:hypothetical protein V502_05022 [Pseudogymnoascus sp. VKM F-4520 (FW-2644)]|nr:hypothetical protein V502_05022 [Pseudogymnoascus sp. VKM F-4520 (FW-2644)]